MGNHLRHTLAHVETMVRGTRRRDDARQHVHNEILVGEKCSMVYVPLKVSRHQLREKLMTPARLILGPPESATRMFRKTGDARPDQREC